MNEQTQVLLDEITKNADRAAKEWIKEVGSNIDERVRSMLDSRLEEIVAKLLGFSNHWGPWELDHCNGRSGESAAGDWLQDRAGETVKAWLDEQAGKLPRLPDAAIKSLKKEYLHHLEMALLRRLEKKAIDDAKEKIDQLLQWNNP